MEHVSDRPSSASIGARKGPKPFQVEPERKTVALVLHPEPSRARAAKRGTGTPESTPERSVEAKLEEAIGLAQAIDLGVIESFIIGLPKSNPATLLGSGKVEELKGIVAALDVELVVVNASLSPVQQRNLERAWQVKVLDRTGLILEIFGLRARTKEGRLQVDLAHLTYQKSRLVRSWTHLERQRGGLGFVGGPGETQIEADRRQIQERITRIERKLGTVKRTRELHRGSRRKVPYPVVALVGYTNAGKSTLFNRLSDAEVMAEDLLFATLDPTMRQIDLPSGRRAVLSDTVGFISDLPTDLIAAFRATLEEVLEADVIIHVRDVSHGDTDAQAADVEQVLSQLGIDEPRRGDIIEVWNKIDRIEDPERTVVANRAERSGHTVVLLSAVSGEGVADLLEALDRKLGAHDLELQVTVGPEQGAELHWIYENADVLTRRDADDGASHLCIRLAAEKLGVLKRKRVAIDAPVAQDAAV
ncbi:MAG: GTPase HflX [Hyphomicrobiales bacterium]